MVDRLGLLLLLVLPNDSFWCKEELAEDTAEVLTGMTEIKL